MDASGDSRPRPADGARRRVLLTISSAAPKPQLSQEFLNGRLQIRRPVGRAWQPA